MYSRLLLQEVDMRVENGVTSSSNLEKLFCVAGYHVGAKGDGYLADKHFFSLFRPLAQRKPNFQHKKLMAKDKPN
jgi:hypothetical protein